MTDQEFKEKLNRVGQALKMIGQLIRPPSIKEGPRSYVPSSDNYLKNKQFFEEKANK